MKRQYAKLAVTAASLLLALSLLHACSEKGPHASWTYDSVVYEMNVRQYTEEGSFQAAAQQLREVGIHCTVDIPAKMDWGGQQACLIGWGSPFDADDHTYKVFGTDKGANYSGYSNEKVDEYLTKARESSDPAVRKEYYDLFQIELANDPAYAFICYIDANYVANARLHGISTDTVMGHHGVGIFWNVREWTLD